MFDPFYRHDMHYDDADAPDHAGDDEPDEEDVEESEDDISEALGD